MFLDSTVPHIDDLDAMAFTVPTDAPESDGTMQWDSTALVIAVAGAGGQTGLGWTYTDSAATTVVTGKLSETVMGRRADSPALPSRIAPYRPSAGAVQHSKSGVSHGH